MAVEMFKLNLCTTLPYGQRESSSNRVSWCAVQAQVVLLKISHASDMRMSDSADIDKLGRESFVQLPDKYNIK